MAFIRIGSESWNVRESVEDVMRRLTDGTPSVAFTIEGDDGQLVVSPAAAAWIEVDDQRDPPTASVVY